MKRFYIKIFGFIILSFLSLNTYAWWSLGHMVVANIAYQNLDATARHKVDVLLEKFKNEHPHVQTLEQMAVWPDNLYSRQKIFLTFHWHFIDIPIYADVVAKKPMNTDNAVWALDKLIHSFKDKQASIYEQSRLLAFLIHIVGDLHQPLHNVSRFSKMHPQGDRGGNDYHIIYKDNDTNLHHLWDSGFGVFEGDQSQNNVTEISKQITAAYPPKYFQDRTINLNPKSWSEEGYSNAVKYVYNTPENQEASDAYIAKGKQLIEEEAALAGYRLAGLLNQLLGKESYKRYS